MTEILNEKELFQTSDIALCATLCCLGYQIERIDREIKSKALFIFKRDEKIDDLIKAYFQHQLKVEPLSFFNFLKEIKTRIYNI